MLQVKYTKMNGQKCHLLGLRDFTDLKSLAGDNATDQIRDGEGSVLVNPQGYASGAGPGSEVSENTSDPVRRVDFKGSGYCEISGYLILNYVYYVQDIFIDDDDL